MLQNRQAEKIRLNTKHEHEVNLKAELEFLVGTTASLTACNMVAGAGADIQKGDAAIKDEANEHR